MSALLNPPPAIADIPAYMEALGKRARAASRVLARADTATKNLALAEIAAALRADRVAILQANAQDVSAAKRAGEDAAFVDRLTLTD